MIDLKALRENDDRFRKGAAEKGCDVKLIDELIECDERLREARTEREQLAAEKNRIGRQIGALAGQIKKSPDGERSKLQEQMKQLQQRPYEIKQRESELTKIVGERQMQRDQLWLQVPQPADPDVPFGTGADDNVQLRCWAPSWFDPEKTFQENKAFAPKTHIELGLALGIIDFEHGVNMAGSRSYVLVGDGMRLHQAVLRYAFDYMVNEHGFNPISVPVLVREHMMVGTGFFPTGKDQSYEIRETDRGGGHDLYLTGTGEVGLMGFHQGEILAGERLPLCYTTVSTCFRREAGAAGKDTAGLYRIHQFDKVEQVVICQASETESRTWHQKMIHYVETLLQRLELPYRLMQCCTGELGPKNADQVDIETWMPGRGPDGPDGRPTGEYGETHSASRLYDYQCRRLNLRYRDSQTNKTVICHALNNTVAASPRLLVPILELYQNNDGSVTVPEALRPYMNGKQRIGDESSDGT